MIRWRDSRRANFGTRVRFRIYVHPFRIGRPPRRDTSISFHVFRIFYRSKGESDAQINVANVGDSNVRSSKSIISALVSIIFSIFDRYKRCPSCRVVSGHHLANLTAERARSHRSTLSEHYRSNRSNEFSCVATFPSAFIVFLAVKRAIRIPRNTCYMSVHLCRSGRVFKALRGFSELFFGLSQYITLINTRFSD